MSYIFEQMECKVFHSPHLIPLNWQEVAGNGEVWVFNPAIMRVNGDLLMAYRVVLADGRRRVAMCRLRDDWTVISGSLVAFSDVIRFADAGMVDDAYHDWIADPRLVQLGGRLYLHVNSGSLPAPNKIYLIEVDPNRLLPVGLAREVTQTGDRYSIEKNWLFFEHAGEPYVIYRFSPLEILSADLSDPHEVRCTPIFRHTWDSFAYTQAYGELRGGATPVYYDGYLWVVAHSVFLNGTQPGPSGESLESLIYVGALILLEGGPPFGPRLISPQPILEALPAEQALPCFPRLDIRCEEDVYPSGAIIEDGALIVSYGLSNKYCVLRRLPLAALSLRLVPAVTHPASPPCPKAWLISDSPVAIGNDEQADDLVLRAFWWDPSGISPRSPTRETKLTEGGFVHGNFGDLFVPHLLGRITGLSPRNTEDNPRLLTVGSLVQNAKDGDVIWGTGMKGDILLRHTTRNLHIFATRGPITLEFLRRAGFDTSRVTRTFDPVSLTPYLLREEIAGMRERIGDRPKDFLLITHFRDYAVMRRLYAAYADHICSPDKPALELVGEILRSNLVVSSSLHGLILAEALGIPAVWHRPLMGENELKFTDYYLGTDRYRIIRTETLKEALRVSPMPLPTFDYEAMLATFPSAVELEEFGLLRRPETLQSGCWISAGNNAPTAIRTKHGWSYPESHGVWSNSNRAELDINIENIVDEVLVLDIRFFIYAPDPENPRRIDITNAGCPLCTITATDSRQHQLEVSIRNLQRTGRWTRFVFLIANPISPSELGLGVDTRRLGVLLQSVRLRPESFGGDID